MSRAATLLLLLIGLLAAAGPSAVGAGELLRQAADAMAGDQYDQALELYEQARALRPDVAEIPYNMGVAAYRAGDLDRAGTLFDEARRLATDPQLRAHSAYNLGTTAFQRAMRQENPTGESADLDHATEELRHAIEQFRETLATDPGDDDARANGELAWRWLKQLEQMQQQMKQQGDSNKQDQSDEQQDQEDQQQQQAQQQQDQQQQGDSQQDQEGQQSPQNDPNATDQPRDQTQQQSGEQDEQAQPQDGDEQEQQQGAEGEQQDAQDGQTQQDDSNQPADRPMTREEARRLLQGVRDRERERQETQARLAAARQPPVDKDW